MLPCEISGDPPKTPREVFEVVPSSICKTRRVVDYGVRERERERERLVDCRSFVSKRPSRTC